MDSETHVDDSETIWKKILYYDAIPHSLTPLMQAIMNYAKASKSSLKEIETRLRKEKTSTAILARKTDFGPGVKCCDILDPFIQKQYMLWLVQGTMMYYIQELLKESTSYQENFKKLDDTGFNMVDPESISYPDMVPKSGTMTFIARDVDDLCAMAEQLKDTQRVYFDKPSITAAFKKYRLDGKSNHPKERIEELEKFCTWL